MTLGDGTWPALRVSDWQDTRDTLHMWTQMVGKVKLALSPPVNHWWHVTFQVGATGLTTGPIPWNGTAFTATFDFLDHVLRVETSRGETRTVALRPRSVADFYGEFTTVLSRLGIEPRIWPMPVEIPNPIRFDRDDTHASYDADAAQAFFRVLLLANRALSEFRSSFLGKCSPVHFFWGSLDLAVTRFSGRRAPERPGVDPVTREAYSHEVISAGFWPGNGPAADAAFYAYAAPEPPGFRSMPIRPERAVYDPTLSEFLFPYDDARRAKLPEAAVRAFLDTTYDAAATLAGWPRADLERRTDSLVS
jgi:hypothetical protein